MQKRYLLAGVAMAASLAIAAPALADTTSQTPPPGGPGLHQGWAGGPGGMRRAPGVFGTVGAINGATLTVTQKTFNKGDESTEATHETNSAAEDGATVTTYTVDASKATVTKGGTTASLSDIAVGDTVMVQGTVSGTDVAATAIRDLPASSGMPQGRPQGAPDKQPLIQGNGQPVIGGAVTAVNDSTLTVTNKSNVTYTVDVSNATVAKGNATTTASSIAVGDSVIVQGAVNGSSVTASSVIDQGAPKTSNGKGESLGHRVMGFFAGIGGFFARLFGF